MGIEGKTAVVTGGGTGIGAAIVRRFRQEGANVIAMGRRKEPLDEIAAATGAVAFPGDASKTEDVRNAVALARERFGGLDIAVPNAGTSVRGSVHELDDATWQGAIEANLNTAFIVCRESLPSLMERQGTIVIVSSLAGLFAGPGSAGYTTTKHALTGLTKAIARDYGPRGVRVNTICPAWVRTPMADRAMDALSSAHNIDRDAAYRLATSEVPLRRAGEPEEIASIALFLASSESSIMTGCLLVADGGAHIVDLPTLALERMRLSPELAQL